MILSPDWPTKRIALFLEAGSPTGGKRIVFFLGTLFFFFFFFFFFWFFFFFCFFSSFFFFFFFTCSGLPPSHLHSCNNILLYHSTLIPLLTMYFLFLPIPTLNSQIDVLASKDPGLCCRIFVLCFFETLGILYYI